LLQSVNLISKLQVEIIPAILVKTRANLANAIESVKPYVKTVQIDVMDDDFVPNKTVGIEELQDLPQGISYEFHWMVQHPEKWIEKISGSHLHIVHVEAKMDFYAVKKAVFDKTAKLGIAINPPTPLEKILPYEKQVSQILVMSVNPGFSGQKYIPEVEEKIRVLRQRNPSLDIEVDGGVNLETISGAAKAGANKLCGASAIFSSKDIKSAIEQLMERAKGAMNG
jgi:ribulose-phosphate 3-epimerase